MTYNNNNVSTATNNNVNTSTSENLNVNLSVNKSNNTNNNVNTNTSTSTNTNIQQGDMTNRNINQNTSTSTSTTENKNTNTNNSTNVNIQQGEMTNRNINETSITQRVIQPPPTAIAPAMMSAGTDLCVTGVSGAAQTQVLGISFGATNRDLNCERLKLSKTLYDMGMKVAAVATMCQDRRVWDAMMAAGTPCPINGMIGEQAREFWTKNPDLVPKQIVAEK